MIEIDIRKVIHTQAGLAALNTQLSIPEGCFYSIFGKSGAGKTTLLKILAGLIEPDDGLIKVNKETWFEKAKKINLKPQKRNIGFVFQDNALFPNMTVEENLGYALGKRDQKTIEEYLKITNLENLAKRYPSQISAGQKQRVALARALIRKPSILFLDEPFSSLDLDTKNSLIKELKNFHLQFGLTTVFVSHDQDEIKALADQVAILDLGKILKKGTPDSIFQHSEEVIIEAVITEFAQDGKVIIKLKEMEYCIQLPPSREAKIGDVVKVKLASS